jgi:hypothetical protein
MAGRTLLKEPVARLTGFAFGWVKMYFLPFFAASLQPSVATF